MQAAAVQSEARAVKSECELLFRTNANLLRGDKVPPEVLTGHAYVPGDPDFAYLRDSSELVIKTLANYAAVDARQFHLKAAQRELEHARAELIKARGMIDKVRSYRRTHPDRD
ncbi:MAG: hypothetical protein HY552_04415 [Elusimicrobia bacterium]|nr:hypothetical protein [Elusimicrobiota bacterium]